MKKTVTSLALLILAFATTPGQGVLSEKKQSNVLFDFRVTRSLRPPNISRATQRKVLSQVFSKYLAAENNCNPDFDPGNAASYLEAARRAGQMVPSLVDTATGSFTAPLQQQVAYIISVGECNASHAENYGSKRIAIFSGEKLVANLDIDFKSSILRKTDLDGDGIDELLLLGGDMNQGVIIEVAALMSFQNGRKRMIEDFGSVSEDSCASGFPGSEATAAVISIGASTPGKMPRLKIDNYRSSCRNVKRWRHVSTGKSAMVRKQL